MWKGPCFAVAYFSHENVYQLAWEAFRCGIIHFKPGFLCYTSFSRREQGERSYSFIARYQGGGIGERVLRPSKLEVTFSLGALW